MYSEDEKLPLTKPFLPPVEDLLPFLERIGLTRQLTNGGPLHQEFEEALCDFLGVPHISLFTNGTLALMIALKTLDLKGEVITTPFTSPATLQAIYWNRLEPVFVDIDEKDLNIDVRLIEAAITPRTCALLPVHIFGTPCNTDGIRRIAEKHNLKVIYDAAHCFGVEKDGISICNSGDLSALSFHATKVFNTLEGGAIVSRDAETKNYIDALKNTGLTLQQELIGNGVNAKMNEVQAAYGLCNLKYIDNVIDRRKLATVRYRELLKNINGLRMIQDVQGVDSNYSYLPILIDKTEFGMGRDELHDRLKEQNIITRKYFYPLVSDYHESESWQTDILPVAHNVAKSILCLPLFHDISPAQIERVAELVLRLQVV